MPIFKAFFKILKSQWVSITVYIGISLLIILMDSGMAGDNITLGFEESITRVAFFNEDGSSEMIEGLKTYLAPHVEYVQLEDSSEMLKDALFYRQVEYIIRVPKGFTEKMISGEETKLDCSTIPNSSNSVYIDLLINEYLNTCKLYTNNVDRLSDQQVAEYVLKDLGIQTEVKLENAKENKGLINYIKYLPYAFLSIFIVGLSTIMNVFNKSMIKKRNSCSPIKQNNISLQILLGCIVFTLAVWSIMTGFGFIINKESIFTQKGIWMSINTLVLALCVASISFLIGISIKDTKAITFLSNILSLGLCFISGVFVPQSFLGDEVLRIACFNPIYWFIKAHDGINMATNIAKTPGILEAIVIQIVFAVVIAMIALVIGKKRRLNY